LQQAEGAVLAIKENYERLEYLKLAFVFGKTKSLVDFYLKKHYPSLTFYIDTYLVKNFSFSQLICPAYQ
jgi:hypothetical protein